jgi:hypothetical protein
MKKKILVMLLIMTINLSVVPQAVANKNIFDQFKSEYNASGTKLDTCMTCMATTTPVASWNKYGLELRNNNIFDRNDPVPAMKNIESLDSDGDGFMNINEIRDSAFPGNASDFPKAQASTTTVTVAETEIPEVTPTATELKSTDTIMNAFFTLLILVGVSFFAIRKRRS